MDMDYLAEKIRENSENLNSDRLNYSGDAIREKVSTILKKLNILTSKIHKLVNSNESTSYRTLIDRLKGNNNHIEEINGEIIDIIKSDIVILLNLYEKNGMKETTFNNIISFNVILHTFKKFKENHLNDLDIDLIIYDEDRIRITNNIPPEYPVPLNNSNDNSNDEFFGDVIAKFFS